MYIYISIYLSICIHTDRCSWMTLNVGVFLLMHHALRMMLRIADRLRWFTIQFWYRC
jgi:hypothetical protein